MITTQPCPIGVRLTPQGWQVVCPPGPMAHLLSQLAEIGEPESILLDGERMLLIPLTTTLDTALESLVNTLIKLRYDTGRVQLELFSEEAI